MFVRQLALRKGGEASQQAGPAEVSMEYKDPDLRHGASNLAYSSDSVVRTVTIGVIGLGAIAQ